MFVVVKRICHLCPTRSRGLWAPDRDCFRSLVPDAGVEASGPHDFAVRVQHVSSSMLPRPPHPVPTSVTIAKRPFVWDGMGELLKMLLPTRKAEYFCDQGWTAVSLICPSGNRRRVRLVKFSVIPAKAGIQYAAASRLITSTSGILDHPLSRVMTTVTNLRSAAPGVAESTGMATTPRNVRHGPPMPDSACRRTTRD